MIIRWMSMLCIALLVTKIQSAAVFSTESTLVAAKTDEQFSSTPSPSDLVTEEPDGPIKLTEMLVRSEVTMRYAHTAVVTHVRNPASKPQEATFHVLLPDTAFISGFVMTLGGKSYKAYVKEKNEAKKIFTEAVSQGTGAAHIAVKARDSNHFTVSVNVEPKSVAIFNLTYEEMLIRRNGVYNHAINLHPGTLVPKLEVVVHIKESQKITTLRVPEVRTGNEIDATDNDAQNLEAVQSRNGEKEATITFTPNLDEQMRLIRIYKEKVKDSTSHQQGLLGQFVVQYDVERTNNGEILVNDGYFVHFLAPNTLPALSKHVVFVLDTSYSMVGRKLEQMKAAMEAILSNLNPNDYFSIVEFNSDYSVHHLKEADGSPPATNSYYYRTQYNKNLEAPAIASPKNIAKAKVVISRLQANGGTNIDSALNVAIDLIHKFAGSNHTTEDLAVVQSNDVKDKIINGQEPIIIFLTDGEPTMGKTSTSDIVSHITEKNSGEMRASLYTLAFGEDADRNFLRKLSLRNEGFMRHIYEAADASLQLRDFYRQVSSPLLAHVKFTYPQEQIKEGTISKSQFRVAYAGSEIVVAGELADTTSELIPRISAFCSNADGARIPYEIRTKVPVSRVKDEFLPLERLWAYLSIKQLLDKRDSAEQSGAEKPEKKALALALKYSFVTSLTSLVVLKPNETNAVNAEPADKIDPQQNNQQQFDSSSFNKAASTVLQSPALQNRMSSRSRHIKNYINNYANGGSNTNGISIGNSWRNTNTVNIGNGMSNTNRINIGNSWRNTNTVNIGNGMSNTNRINIGNGRSNVNYGRQNHRGWHGYGSDSEEDEDYGGSPPVSLHIIGNGGRKTYFGRQKIRGWHNNYGSRIMGGYGYGDTSDEEDNDQTNFRMWNRPHFRKSYTPSYTAPRVPSTTPLILTTEVPDVKKYHLENYSWALGLLNNSADALIFWENEIQILLELSKDANPPQSSGPEELCQNTPVITYGPATCVYITRCSSAKNITVDDYRKSYCRVDNKYAGVCCPSSDIDVTGT